MDILNIPLDPIAVKKRRGPGGKNLSYLEGHDVVRKANTIFGVGGWSYRVQSLKCLGDEVIHEPRSGLRVAYRAVVELQVSVSDRVATFSDVGYGDCVDYGDSELTPHELAAKEAVTDALKRCFKNLGNQFGLGLYDKDSPEHKGLEGLKEMVYKWAKSKLGDEITVDQIAELMGCSPDDLRNPEKLRELALQLGIIA